MANSSDYVGALESFWAETRPEVDMNQYAAAIRLIRIGRLLQESLRTISSQNGLSVRGDYEVLATLRRSRPSPLTPGVLAQQSMLTTAGMTGRLDRLESAGLIFRSSNPADRRSVLVSITANGSAMADRILDSSVDHIATRVLGDVPVDWDLINDVLVDVLRLLEPSWAPSAGTPEAL